MKLLPLIAPVSNRRRMARTRKTVQVTIPGDLIDWMDSQVKERVYHHRSHLVEVAVLRLRAADTSAKVVARR